MGTTTVFADAQDSPIFRLRVAELESSADTLRGRTKKLVSGAVQYCIGLEESLQAALQFADVLEEFCGGTDEDSASVGGPTMVRFVHVLRELSSFTELLRTQVEVMVCGRLGEEAAAEAAELRESRRLVQQRSAEYDAARARHLGHRGRVPWGPGRGVTPEKSQLDMAAARAAAEEARLAMARKLADAHLKRRHIFLEAIGSVMQSMLKYHQHGLTAMQSVGPYIEQMLALADRHKGDAAVQMAALEELIQGQRQADEARAASVPPAEYAGPASSGKDSPGPLRLGSATAAAAGPPRQMTRATTQLAAELEGFIRATQESGGALVTVLLQGYLLKQSSKIKSQWHRRFFVLDSNGML
jgi:Arf-GAP/coiled-coil/ANK repeat/PH domain-containing protein